MGGRATYEGCGFQYPAILDSMQIILGRIHIVVVSGGVDNKLNVVGPSESGIRHFKLLPIVMMVRDSSVKHAESGW